MASLGHFDSDWPLISGKFDHVFLLVGRDIAQEKGDQWLEFTMAATGQSRHP